eukprot:7428569-Lingulodinium_polyedra.AAC.1
MHKWLDLPRPDVCAQLATRASMKSDYPCFALDRWQRMLRGRALDEAARQTGTGLRPSTLPAARDQQ